MSGIDVNKELLIALIEEKPVLWDKCDETYKDRNATKEAWNEVCVGLKEDFKTLKDSERNVFANSPLSNLWSIEDLLPDHPDELSIQERWEATRRNLRFAHAAVWRNYDRRRQPSLFSIGSWVWLRNYPQSRATDKVAAKLCPRYRGPFTLVKYTSPVSVQLADSDGHNRIWAHVSQLKAA
ncbi:uncharacterized protein LOC117282996 [Cryptotermes secundus]|uniref:uncharacterized protein LOC117282996 n=1 Tax=Cryptotermes secundus TaxID=105785 RepID=UPI001454D54F|nr:uncharacterized protein LOC117282996 [Cryptotermes secundus]